MNYWQYRINRDLFLNNKDIAKRIYKNKLYSTKSVTLYIKRLYLQKKKIKRLFFFSHTCISSKTLNRQNV